MPLSADELWELVIIYPLAFGLIYVSTKLLLFLGFHYIAWVLCIILAILGILFDQALKDLITFDYHGLVTIVFDILFYWQYLRNDTIQGGAIPGLVRLFLLEILPHLAHIITNIGLDIISAGREVTTVTIALLTEIIIAIRQGIELDWSTYALIITLCFALEEALEGAETARTVAALLEQETERRRLAQDAFVRRVDEEVTVTRVYESLAELTAVDFAWEAEDFLLDAERFRIDAARMREWEPNQRRRSLDYRLVDLRY